MPLAAGALDGSIGLFAVFLLLCFTNVTVLINWWSFPSSAPSGCAENVLPRLHLQNAFLPFCVNSDDCQCLTLSHRKALLRDHYSASSCKSHPWPSYTGVDPSESPRKVPRSSWCCLRSCSVRWISAEITVTCLLYLILRKAVWTVSSESRNTCLPPPRLWLHTFWQMHSAVKRQLEWRDDPVNEEMSDFFSIWFYLAPSAFL